LEHEQLANEAARVVKLATPQVISMNLATLVDVLHATVSLAD
jgi:hypothetical protein